MLELVNIPCKYNSFIIRIVLTIDKQTIVLNHVILHISIGRVLCVNSANVTTDQEAGAGERPPEDPAGDHQETTPGAGGHPGGLRKVRI